MCQSEEYNEQLLFKTSECSEEFRFDRIKKWRSKQNNNVIRRFDLTTNEPEDIKKLPSKNVKILVDWIKQNLFESDFSYTLMPVEDLKTYFTVGHFQVSKGAFMGAMIMCKFRPIISGDYVGFKIIIN